jgi:hypothetical protein
MRRYDRVHTLFYLDPPYWQTEGYGVPFAWPEYEAMADTLKALEGKAILSINDHPDVRRCFVGFHMESLDITYEVAGGQRGAERKEPLIFSWDVAAEPAGLFQLQPRAAHCLRASSTSACRSRPRVSQRVAAAEASVAIDCSYIAPARLLLARARFARIRRCCPSQKSTALPRNSKGAPSRLGDLTRLEQRELKL